MTGSEACFSLWLGMRHGFTQQARGGPGQVQEGSWAEADFCLEHEWDSAGPPETSGDTRGLRDLQKRSRQEQRKDTCHRVTVGSPGGGRSPSAPHHG